MGEVPDKKQRQARRAAAISVTFVFLFAFAFIGLVLWLDNWVSDHEVQEEVPVATEAPSDPFYVLLIGSDSRKGTAIYTGKANEHAQVDQHSDIMTLMRIDPLERKITLVSVPRDTVLDEQGSKINESLLSNDPEQVVDAVAELTGVRADAYMMTTFVSFENLVNALGGIDVDVAQSVVVTDPATGKRVTVKEGKNRHLDGAEALVFARARKEYGENQEALRQVNVRQIEKALIKKVLDFGTSAPDVIEHVLVSLDENTKTNIDLSAMGLIMLDFAAHADQVTIYDCTGPYNGGTRESDGQWVVEEDKATWRLLMKAVDAGEDPSFVVEAPSF